jgi:hypothetical protein
VDDTLISVAENAIVKLSLNGKGEFIALQRYVVDAKEGKSDNRIVTINGNVCKSAHKHVAKADVVLSRQPHIFGSPGRRLV